MANKALLHAVQITIKYGWYSIIHRVAAASHRWPFSRLLCPFLLHTVLVNFRLSGAYAMVAWHRPRLDLDLCILLLVCCWGDLRRFLMDLLVLFYCCHRSCLVVRFFHFLDRLASSAKVVFVLVFCRRLHACYPVYLMILLAARAFR